MRNLMLALGLILALTTSARGVVAAEVPSSAIVSTFAATAADLTPELQSGTLLFSEGDCLAIRVYTASPYTHVAVVCIEEGKPVVYDSMNGIGVRRQTLASYLAAESPNELQILQPETALTAEQGRALDAYLGSQLGRPYAIHHHITGQRAEGVHCAEYATDALMTIGLITAEHPSRVSPASLATGITRANIYSVSRTVELDAPLPPQEQASNGCHQLWIDTKLCTAKCCDKLTGWFLCR